MTDHVVRSFWYPSPDGLHWIHDEFTTFPEYSSGPTEAEAHRIDRTLLEGVAESSSRWERLCAGVRLRPDPKVAVRFRLPTNESGSGDSGSWEAPTPHGGASGFREVPSGSDGGVARPPVPSRRSRKH